MVFCVCVRDVVPVTPRWHTCRYQQAHSAAKRARSPATLLSEADGTGSLNLSSSKYAELIRTIVAAPTIDKQTKEKMLMRILNGDGFAAGEGYNDSVDGGGGGFDEFVDGGGGGGGS